MFENRTYENLMQEALALITSDVDKQEGSLIRTALSPCIYKLAETYINLDNLMDLFYLDTAVGEYLDHLAADYGNSRKEASNAVRKIATTGAVDIGTRWGINEAIYLITAYLSTNVYSSICEQSGEIGNIYSGTLENIDGDSGVTAALTDIITSGSDEETDDELRVRIKEHLLNPSQDGNVAQYKKWAIDYDGIGVAKVFPLWNGGNTVKIAITNANYLPAESKLVSDFQNYMDPNAEGKGNGVAPIGSKVTITGGTQKNIAITANIVLADGYTDAEGATETIVDYLTTVAFIKNTVSYMRIGSALLDCSSILDLSNLKINNGTSDIVLVNDEIPVLTNISLVVTT